MSSGDGKVGLEHRSTMWSVTIRYVRDTTLLGTGSTSKVFRCQCVGVEGIDNGNPEEHGEEREERIGIDVGTKTTECPVRPGHSYAVKMFPRFKLERKSARSRLRTELEIHKSVHHPNIVRLLDAFDDSSGNVYFVLELCHTEDLCDRLKRVRRLEEPLAANFIGQVVDALRYLHERNVIHRDVKLKNIFFHEREQDIILLGDFGLATRMTYPEERKYSFAGTPNFVAPEIVECNRDGRNGYSFEADVWSTGVTLYCLLVGNAPFANGTTEVATVLKNIERGTFSFPDEEDEGEENNGNEEEVVVPVSNTDSIVRVSALAKQLVRSMLRSDPKDRIRLEDFHCHPWMQTMKT